MTLTRGKLALLERFAHSLRTSGWQVLWIEEDHPAKIRLIKGDRSFNVWLYIWNLTGGGRAGSRPLERRIQITNIGDRFHSAPGAYTLILGWSNKKGVFAAFDHSFHSFTLGSSSSIQTEVTALEEAASNGLGVFSKGNGELSIAVRPDFLGFYIENINFLHTSGNSPGELDLLRRITSDALNVQPGEISENIRQPRHKVAMTVLRLLRDRRFSENVLNAYGHRCALCGIQLRLIDAAHILPVAHPESDDRTTNGVALCALHHRAYDTALVTFDDDYTIRVSQSAVDKLTDEDVHDGLESFREALHSSLILPGARSNHPSTFMIRKANELRGWT